MNEIKIYRIKGEIRKKKFFEPMTFIQEVAAVKKNHALQQVYTLMGSRHRAKRNQIIIESIEETPIGESNKEV